MKKILAVLLCAFIVAAAFAGCKKTDNNPKQEENVSTTSLVTTTDTAKYTKDKAINFIKSYNAKELSLTKKEYNNCDFLVNDSGVEVDGENYIKIIAVYMNEEKSEDGKTTVKFDHRGEYFIRYDGEKILKKNMDSEKDEYTELKLKKSADDTETTDTEKD